MFHSKPPTKLIITLFQLEIIGSLFSRDDLHTILFYAEGVYIEENSCHLCFLLCEEDSCTLGHFLLLLHGYTN